MASTTESNGSDKLYHLLDLNEHGLEEVGESDKPRVVKEVADFIKNETLRKISNGTSPVQGEGRFRILNAEYAREQKGGVRTANLELEGDLKDSLISSPFRSHFVKYGHEGSQVPKSDGHNQMSEKAKAWARSGNHPKRRYVPGPSQKFDSSIMNEVRKILKSNKRADEPDIENEFEDDEGGVTAFSLFEDGPTNPATTFNLDRTSGDLFSDDVISELLDDAFRRRNF